MLQTKEQFDSMMRRLRYLGEKDAFLLHVANVIDDLKQQNDTVVSLERRSVQDQNPIQHSFSFGQD